MQGVCCMRLWTGVKHQAIVAGEGTDNSAGDEAKEEARRRQGVRKIGAFPKAGGGKGWRFNSEPEVSEAGVFRGAVY